mgnify:CR=1 FL=1
MEWITNPEIWVALATLTTLEIILGIDNIVFISILSLKLPKHQQLTARRVGLAVGDVGAVAPPLEHDLALGFVLAERLHDLGRPGAGVRGLEDLDGLLRGHRQGGVPFAEAAGQVSPFEGTHKVIRSGFDVFVQIFAHRFW